MSVRRLAPDSVQPASFEFSPENKAWLAAQLTKYPEGKQASMVIPALWQAQKQAGGWVSKAAIEHIAQCLSMPNIRVLEVASFYTMFNLEPVGQYFVQLCGTVPCHCMGALDLKDVLKKRIGDERHITPDGKFSWLEVECLGACTNAPMVQINDDYFEDLTVDSFNKLLDDLAAGKPVQVGPQNGRKKSEPKDNINTLLDAKLYDGSKVGGWQKDFDARVAAAQQAKAAAAAAAPAPAAVAAAPAVAAPARPADAKSNAAQDTPAAGGAAVTAKGSAGGEAKKAETNKPEAAAAPERVVGDEAKPELLSAARGGKADDLELIWGVGPKLGQMLNRMGIYHFDQVASWNDDNLAWVDQNLEGFKGRASRDKWIEQAKKLATGWRPDSKLGDKPE